MPFLASSNKQKKLVTNIAISMVTRTQTRDSQQLEYAPNLQQDSSSRIAFKISDILYSMPIMSVVVYSVGQ